VLVALLGVLAVLWVRKRSALLYLVAPSVGLLIWVFWQPIFDAFSRGQSIGMLTSLSGRVTWWDAALKAATEHLWTGFGFGAGGRFVALERAGFGSVSSLHNGYLEALLGVGLIGLSLLLTIVYFAIIRTWSARSHDLPRFSLVIPLLVQATVTLGFGGWLGSSFILLGLLAVLPPTPRLFVSQRAPTHTDTAVLARLK
jgi:O-antigen ligase